jgi:hypothetical protein
MIPPTKRRAGHNQNEPTHVYVMTCEGRVKIGVAADVATRLDHLQMACPLPIEVAHKRLFPSRTNARLVERSLHARFGANRLHGEWFAIDAAEAVAAVLDAEEIAGPVKIEGRLRRKEPERPAYIEPAPMQFANGALIKREGWRAGEREATWEEMEAMTDHEWCEYMRPLAETLDFSSGLIARD